MQLFVRFRNHGVVFLFVWVMGIFVTGLAACSHQKPGCGNKHQHKMRAKKVKRMAPGMSM